MRQTGFGFLKDYKKEFGGSLLIGKRKSARPLSIKHPLHLVLKSSGNSYFHPGHRAIEKILRECAQRYQIIIYELSLNWSHIHLLLKLPTRNSYSAFIRTVTASMVNYLSLQIGKSLQGLFDLRPFTRILSWGREFQKLIDYLEINELEGRGLFFRKKESPPSKGPITARRLQKG